MRAAAIAFRLSRLSVRLCVGLLLAALLAPPAAGQTVVRHLEIEAALAERAIESLLVRYRSVRSREVAARARVEELSAELDRRLGAGDTRVAELESLADDLSIATGRAESAAEDARLVRHDLLRTMQRRDTIAAELRRVRGAPADLPDPLTGTWELEIEPQGRRGLLDLTLDGTRVRGTLGLDDGSFGSVTGTFTGGRLQLERVSAEAGLDMALEGRVAADGTLRGTWRPLVLGRGEPPGGTWTASRPEADGETEELTGEGSGGER